jgi:hypothetical protein
VPAMPSFTYDALRINEELNQFHWTARKFIRTALFSHTSRWVAVENTGQRFTDMSRAYGERGGSFIDETVVLEEWRRGNHFGSVVNHEESDSEGPLCRRT